MSHTAGLMVGTEYWIGAVCKAKILQPFFVSSVL